MRRLPGRLLPGMGSRRGTDVFGHGPAIETSGYRSLEENQKVQYTVTRGPKRPASCRRLAA